MRTQYFEELLTSLVGWGSLKCHLSEIIHSHVNEDTPASLLPILCPASYCDPVQTIEIEVKY